MSNFFRHLLLVALTLTIVDVMGSDSLKVNSFNAFKINNFQNFWHPTENAAGMIYNLPENITDFNTGLVNSNGDFHRIMEGSKARDYLLMTKSVRKIDKFFLSGSFAYQNQQESGARWNGTLEPYRGNPYILGDSVIGASYRKENYALSGGIATNINPNVSIGCKIDYFVAVGAKQKDPRPQNKVIRFVLNPGIIFHREKYDLGADLGFANRKEEIDYSQFITDNPDISYFAFKGFGFYAKEIGMDYYRFQNENALFGGFQFRTKKTKLPSLTELKFKYGKETIDDGSSAPVKERGGDWDFADLNLKEIVQYGTSELSHKIELNAGYFKGNGSEFTQEKVYNGTVTEYVTISTNLKFERKILQGQLEYTAQKLKTAQKINWIFNSRIGAFNNNETYYYVPEIFTSGYTNLLGFASLEKDFYLISFHFAPFLAASYTYNLSNNLVLSDLPEITKKELKEIYIHDFNYQTDNLFKLEAHLVCGYFTKKARLSDQLFVHLNFSYYKPSANNYSFSILTAKIGFMF